MFPLWYLCVWRTPDSSQSQAGCPAQCVIGLEARLRRGRYCLDGTVWTAPLVVLVICFGSILAFMTIVFLFVYLETRRATGQVRHQSLLGFTSQPQHGTQHASR